MPNRPYIEFLRYARRVSKRSDEAEDLLQTVLLAAVEAGRTDLTCANNRRWLNGALRNRAQFEARSASRRRRRELAIVPVDSAFIEAHSDSIEFISALPRSLRTTALLVLTGHTKAEILWLQQVSDCALRQRLVSIKRRWQQQEGVVLSEMPGLRGSLPFGKIRRALLKPIRQEGMVLASHDPDGNLFVVYSQKHPARQLVK